MKAAVAIREGNAFAVDALAKGDILNMSGKKGMTLLMYALLTATKKTDASFQIVTELVKKGADPLYIIPQYGSAADAMALRH
ncbi:hypothetical protein ABIE06_003990 [Pantoea dispersa]|uniref:hypothetical protein n=1 Tax=Pantoea dispersa TaxID=59814 RepID=UPI003D197D78